jgi:hypothetical protein
MQLVAVEVCAKRIDVLLLAAYARTAHRIANTVKTTVNPRNFASANRRLEELQ